MRSAAIICGFLALCIAGWHAYFRQSAIVSITSEYALTYTVAWGWGMDQQVAFSRRWVPRPVATSEWIAIWKRPYNSGAAVYVTDRGDRYYVGTTYKLLIVDIPQGRIYSSCDTFQIPARTALGEKLLLSGAQGYQQMDPGAFALNRYIGKETLAGAAPNEPPPSRYYLGLRYLGRFGIVEPDKRVTSRGSEVRFVPAQNEPEPRLALQFDCG